MNPDGSDIKQLTNGSDEREYGKWSPDAKQIAYNLYGNFAAEVPPIYLMNSDGSNQHLLSSGMQMSWSPDGSKIISSSYGYPLYITEVSTGNSEATPLWGGAPDWSPDGNYIIYSFDISTVTDSILLYNKIVKYPGFDSIRVVGPKSVGSLKWSPDGKYFAFGGKNIYIMKADGSNIEKVTDNKNSFAYYISWSPDGNSLVFLGGLNNGSNKSYIYMVNKDGTNLHRVIDDPSVISVDWSR